MCHLRIYSVIALKFVEFQYQQNIFRCISLFIRFILIIKLIPILNGMMLILSSITYFFLFKFINP